MSARKIRLDLLRRRLVGCCILSKMVAVVLAPSGSSFSFRFLLKRPRFFSGLEMTDIVRVRSLELGIVEGGASCDKPRVKMCWRPLGSHTRFDVRPLSISIALSRTPPMFLVRLMSRSWYRRPDIKPSIGGARRSL